MRRIFQKELDMILHWNLTLVGGFLGTYAILLHAGNFGSAQTGNVMEMAAALTGKKFAEVGIPDALRHHGAGGHGVEQQADD